MKNTKHILTVLILTLLVSCSKDERLNEFLHARYLVLDKEYKERYSSIKMYISEQPENKEEKVFLAAKRLDSLYIKSINNISEKNGGTEELEKFINSTKELVLPTAKFKWTDYSNIPNSVEKEASMIAVVETSKRVQEELAKQLGGDDFKFDVLRIFIEPESTDIGMNEKFQAKVFFGAYNAGLSETIIIKVDGKELELVDGVGSIEILPKNKGKNTVEIKATSKKKSKYWKDWTMDRSVDFNVK